MPNAWPMYAGRPLENRDNLYLTVEYHEASARMYGVEKPIPVTAIEDPEGPYYGWLDGPDLEEWRQARDHPVMIQPHEGMFRMQFPYGPEAEEDRGRGRVVRLRIEEVHGVTE